ncbi:tape-measure protein [Streptomyces yaizuensis]|uniref:Tape-measure protein n=1 Tax=Streptomyces yaizuensis TaxID=2989713 RepID=A0ABQ5P4M3_9ACTN|nr:tape-measure protein [Streptomyces sp. YSPA8]GLF97543.1 tape-measure protein [Streptomyces sp. YSPA8]
MSALALGRGGPAGAADPVGNLLAGMVQPLNQLRAQVKQMTGAARSSVATLRTAAGSVDRIRSAADSARGAVSGLRTGATGSVRPVTAVGTSAGRAAAGLEANGRSTRSSSGAAAALAGGAAGLVSVTELLGAAGVTIGPLMTALGGGLMVAAGAVMAMNVTMRANPIGFVAGLLVPIVAYLIELAVNSRTGQRIIKQVFDQVLKGFQAIGRFLAPVVGFYATVISTAFGVVRAVVTGELGSVGAVIGKGFPAVRDGVGRATNAVTGLIRTTWNGLRNAVKPLVDWITKDIPAGFTRVKNATGDTLGGIGGFITTGFQLVAGAFKLPLEGLISFANWVIDKLNGLSFSILGKKFGVDIPKIPMLAEGGVALPASGSRPGAVLPLGAVAALRAAEPRERSGVREPRRVRLETYREPAGRGAYGVAEELLFLARAA